MKLRVFTFLTASAALFAQSDTATFVPDINGNAVEQTGSVSTPGDHTLFTRSPNGTTVPREKTESRILSEGPGGKVVETTIQHYGFDGQPSMVERVVSEEQKRPDGSTVHETRSWSDVNGTLHEGERRVIESQIQGNTTSTSVEVLRAGLGGDFVPAEKRNVITITSDGKISEDETIYKPAGNGEFHQTGRNIKEAETIDGKTISRETIYQADLQGQLHVEGGEVKTVTKSADGAEMTQVDILGPAAGRATSADAPQVVREQKTVVRHPGPDGTVVETTTVSEAALDASNRLGNARVVSETVCQGKCGGSPAPAAAATPETPKPAGP